MESTFIQEQNETREDYNDQDTHKRRWTIRSILCQTSLLGWLFVCSFSLIVPLLTYYLVVDLGSYKLVDTYTCFVNQTFRVPCGKINATEAECVQIGCCYDKPTKICYHYLPSRYSYDLVNSNYEVSRSATPYYTPTIKALTMSIKEKTKNKVSIYLHQESKMFNSSQLSEKNYVVRKTKEKLMVEIFRPNGDLLLSTAKGPLIASEKYWEWTVYLTNHSLFGFGHTLIKRHRNSTFNKVFYKNKHDHSSSPIVWAYNNGSFHGLTINYTGPLEVTILESNMIILKCLAGNFIELGLVVGPTPKDIHNQLLSESVSENRTLPYWALQTLICKKQNHFLNLTDLTDQFQIDSKADSYCINENLLMGILVESYNRSISDANPIDEIYRIVTDQRTKGKKFLLSVPPQAFMNYVNLLKNSFDIIPITETWLNDDVDVKIININNYTFYQKPLFKVWGEGRVMENTNLYTSAENLNLFYTFNNTIYKGVYLEQNVSYPDYSHQNIQKYMEEFDNFLNNYVNLTIDGIILTDNWPVNEEFLMDNSSFPYFNKRLQDAMSYTIQWNTTIDNNLHIQKHNSYGASHYEAFKTYYQSKSPDMIIMSASKTMVQSESTIIEDVETSWTNLSKYLLNLLFESISGNHLVSLPVCGDTTVFDPSIQEKLCLRWYLVATTMPMFRVSSPEPWRNPDDLNTKYAQKVAQSAIDTRNQLLPYYYWIINKNEPVIRPMFYDFYENTTTFSLNEQYMIGDKILVAHPMTAERTKMTIYLPPKIKVWYEFWGGEIYTVNKTNSMIRVSVQETDLLAFIAQGSIISMKSDKVINLIIALNCTNNETTATGSMQTDDVAITFTADATAVSINSTSNTKWNLTLGYIKVYHYLNNTDLKNFYQRNAYIDQSTTSVSYVTPPTTTTESTTTTTESTTATESTTITELTTPSIDPTTEAIVTSESTPSTDPITTEPSTANISSDSTTTNPP